MHIHAYAYVCTGIYIYLYTYIHNVYKQTSNKDSSLVVSHVRHSHRVRCTVYWQKCKMFQGQIQVLCLWPYAWCVRAKCACTRTRVWARVCVAIYNVSTKMQNTCRADSQEECSLNCNRCCLKGIWNVDGSANCECLKGKLTTRIISITIRILFARSKNVSFPCPPCCLTSLSFSHSRYPVETCTAIGMQRHWNARVTHLWLKCGS